MYLHKYSDVEGKRPIEVPVGIQGYFKIEAINKFSGKRRVLADWFPNQILDAGRNYMATNNSWLSACQVGTDSTAPTALQTSLGGYVAGTTNIESDGDTAQGSAPYFGYRQLRWRFPVGQTAANLSEVGIGWGTTGATLFTRALIVDGNGDPTTVTPLADEILDVTYQLRYYPPLVDATGTIQLGGVTYDTIVRAMNVTNSAYWSDGIGYDVGVTTISGGWGAWSAWDGAIGAITSSPSGNSSGVNTTPFDFAYSNNSYQRDVGAQSDPGGWYLAAGIRSIGMSTSLGGFQTQFTAQGTGNPIPKTTLQTLALTWRLTWVVATVP